MRIGNWLGGSVIWALAAIDEYGGNGTHRRARHDRPLGGSLDGQSGDHYYGVYVPTRFGGELKVKATDGQGRRAQGAQRDAARSTARTSASISRAGIPSRSRAPRSPTRSETTLRPGRPEHEEALELLLLAHQGRLDPRALGRRQCPGRHDDT